MKPKTNLTCYLLLFSLLSFAQTDYKSSTKYKDGYTSIYITIPKKATAAYSSTSTEYRHGLLVEKTQKIVLPTKYKSVYYSNEDGLYIVQDTLEKWGLYSAKTQIFLLEPTYNKVEVFTDGVGIVQKRIFNNGWYDYYYGAIDKTGKLIVADTFTYLGVCRDGLMSFKQNGRYGYMDKQANIVIPAMYTSAKNFANGLASVQVDENSKFGYINKENRFIVEPKYVDAESFYEGYASVYTEKKFYSMKGGNVNTDKVGVIDTKGNEVIPPIYETVSLKRPGGIFKVTKNEKQGLIDSTGKIILPVENKKIDEFYSDIARVEKTSGMFGLINKEGKWLLPADYTELSSLYSSDGFYVKKDGKYSVYDKNMKVIIPADTAKRVAISKKNIAYVFDNAIKVFDISGKLIKTMKQESVDLYGTNFFSNDDSLKIAYFKTIILYNLQTKTHQKLIADDVADFNEEGIFLVKLNSKYIFHDYTGKKLYAKSFENAINFSEGICALQENSYSKPYLADKMLAKITELSTVFYGPYSEGLAMTKSQYGGTIYYLNKQGKEQFSVYGTEGSACKNNRIKIKNSYGKFFFVNKSGNRINSSTYDDLGDFCDGLAGFKDNKKGGYIDTSGNVAIAAIYDEVSNFTNSTAMVKQNNLYFQIDIKGNAINDAKYTGVSNPANGSFPVKKENKFGLIDSKGNTIVDFKYNEIGTLCDGMIWARKEKDGKFILLNKSGNEISTNDYDACGSFENDYAQVTKNNKGGIIDKAGKLVLPIEYSNLSKVYKNTVIVVKPSGAKIISIK